MKKIRFDKDLEQIIRSTDINYVNKAEILCRLFIVFVVPILLLPLNIVGNVFGAGSSLYHVPLAMVAVFLTQMISFFSKSNRESSRRIVLNANRLISNLLEIMNKNGVDVSKESLVTSVIVKSTYKNDSVIKEEEESIFEKIFGSKNSIVDFHMLDRKGQIQVLRQIREMCVLDNRRSVKLSTYLLEEEDKTCEEEVKRVYIPR